jgi:inhibitor of cysteine peptidase
MKLISKIIFLAASVLAIAAVFTEKQGVITVNKQSPTFTIRLAANPTTGYTWSLQSYDNKVLVSTEHHFVPAKTKLIGAGGYEDWSFRVVPAAKRATTKIVFVYSRAWEKNEIGKKVEFSVKIK